jgi:hypothetical protein
MVDEIKIVEGLVGAVENTSPIAAFFMGATTLFVVLTKRIFLTNDMAKVASENAVLVSKVEFLEAHIVELEKRLEKLEATPRRRGA